MRSRSLALPFVFRVPSLRPLLLLPILMTGVTPGDAEAQGAFQSIGDETNPFSEFTLADRTPLQASSVDTARSLLGKIRAVTTGDYDQDGDEDVLAARFACEKCEGTQRIFHQFVLYDNLWVESGSLQFRLVPNALPFPDPAEMKPANLAIWSDLDGSNFSGTVSIRTAGRISSLVDRSRTRVMSRVPLIQVAKGFR